MNASYGWALLTAFARNERLTPDVTYRGLPLSKAAYAAHMRFLRELAAKDKLSTWRSTTLVDDAEHEAWIAIGPLTREYPDGGGYSICLTDYGKIYLRQREEPMLKRYRLLDQHDSNILGDITGDNVYITAYPVPLAGEKHPRDLEVGEASRCKYNLSGTSGVYRVLRLQDADSMKFKLKIEGDTLSLTVTDVDDTPAARGRVCNIELALLRMYGSHVSEAVVPQDNGKLLFLFHRGSSDHALYMRCREVLQGFNIEV